MKKFKYFGVIIHPAGAEKHDWKNLEKAEITSLLRDLSFPTPKEVGITLTNLLVKGDKKAQKSWVSETNPEYYYGKVEKVIGQLELGDQNNRPHYQLWVSMKPQVPRPGMIKELSKKFYNEESSGAISVLTLSVDNDPMIEYCQKEKRANLTDEYAHVQINSLFSEYEKYLEENPDSKIVEENPYSYQKWLKQFILEKQPTREITWLVDIAGDSGKSIFTDLQELNPIMGVCRLSIDYNRSFKYLAAYDIKEYIEKYSNEPSVLMIDAPRDEETKYLHEIYGTLEELSNGRVEGFFAGRRIKFRIRRGIKVIVISNSPPVLKALSSDRWQIKAIFKSADGKDRLVQQAKVTSKINDVTLPFCTWQNVTETVLPDSFDETLSGKMLEEMFLSNYEEMKNKKENIYEFNKDEKYVPGIVKSWSPEQTLELFKVPEYVKRQAQKLLSFKARNTIDKKN